MRCEHPVYRSFSIGLNERSIDISQSTPRHWFLLLLSVFSFPIGFPPRSSVPLLAAILGYTFISIPSIRVSFQIILDCFPYLHWGKSRLDVESRLLKTSTRKNTLDSIDSLLKSKGNPTKSRDSALRFKKKSE